MFNNTSTYAKCKKCGQRILSHYTYCKSCFYELGSPENTVIDNHRVHKCKKCGALIQGRYYFCPDCAKKLGYMK